MSYPSYRDGILKDESRVRVIGPRDKGSRKGAINCCSHSDNWTRGLSPFVLGPCNLWDGRKAQVMENAWQFGKVYPGQWNARHKRPSREWRDWSDFGFELTTAVRYPMGKGAIPLGYWYCDELISYIKARRLVYWPLYRDCVRRSVAFATLEELFKNTGRLTLWDFDGYDTQGVKTLREVLHDKDKKMGHAFVLAAMLIYGDGIKPDKLP